MIVPPTLDLMDNVTPTLKDGLDLSVTIVKGLDSALRATALNVSRMDCGLENFVFT